MVFNISVPLLCLEKSQMGYPVTLLYSLPQTKEILWYTAAKT